MELIAVCRSTTHAMWITCNNVAHMSKMIQIRNVPDEVHRQVKARAALAGMSLSDYLLQQVERSLEVPPVEEVLERLSRRVREPLAETPAEAVRAERSSR